MLPKLHLQIYGHDQLLLTIPFQQLD